MLPSSLNYNLIRDSILSAKDPWEGKTPENPREGCKVVSEILGGLYISNDAAFGKTFRESNPHNFEAIISACGFPRIQRAIPDLATVKRLEVETYFQERKVEWLQIGDAVPDDDKAWGDIVFNATFPQHPLARADFEIERKSTKPEDVEFRAKRRKIVEEYAPGQWFKPTFELLRQAVAGKKTLVHCHHGASRSPAVVVAFLIHDYHVSAEQAVAFLRSKRYCVDPKCIKDLQHYAIALQKKE